LAGGSGTRTFQSRPQTGFGAAGVLVDNAGFALAGLIAHLPLCSGAATVARAATFIFMELFRLC
jgi:hypothetical protein